MEVMKRVICDMHRMLMSIGYGLTETETVVNDNDVQARGLKKAANV